MFNFVLSIPFVKGNIGILAFLYSSDLYKLNAQKCDGVQKKIIRKNVIGSKDNEFVAIVQPITGGRAPAAPPITMF